MPSLLHTHHFGPETEPELLAIHGLTGHGQRWQRLADYLPQVSVLAPDLLGHGHSSWSAPWTIEANAAQLAELITAGKSVVVVAHSFGCAVALALAAQYRDRVRALVLLDPAVGLDGQWMATIAQAMFDSPDYPDRAQARAEKTNGSWADVPADVLDAELDEHLVPLPNGRFSWRISLPAMMSYWSELTRPPALPNPGLPVTVVRASRTTPPYVTEALLEALSTQLGDALTVLDVDSDHMVEQTMPAQVAALIRPYLA